MVCVLCYLGFCISALDHGLLGVIVFVVIVVMFYIVLL